MITYLSKYFYIKEFHRDQANDDIDGLTGYFTDPSHTLFLPPQKITREEAIAMINAGIILFTNTKEGRHNLLKKVEDLNGNFAKL